MQPGCRALDRHRCHPPPAAACCLLLCAADSNIGDADAAALGMDTQPPEFYDEEADERNEAWVQKMRR
jgi:hypothetical protein